MADDDLLIRVLDESPDDERIVAHAFIEGVPVLLVVVTESTYAFTWPGRLDFNVLELELFGGLFDSLRNGNDDFPLFPSSITARLITAIRHFWKRDYALREFETVPSNEYFRTRRTEQIVFARFDLRYVNRYHEENVAVTASNPKYDKRPTASIRCSREHPVTAALWLWMARLADRRNVMLRHDPFRISEQLNAFVGGERAHVR